MAGVRNFAVLLLRIAAVAAVTLAVIPSAFAQMGAGAPPGPKNERPAPRTIELTGNEPTVLDVQVEGNITKSEAKVLKEIGTRVGRPFDKEQLQRDVRKLASRGWFLDVKPEVKELPGGVTVTFKVVERPVLEYVKIIGNSKLRRSAIEKKLELKAGMARDPYAVEEGRRKIEQFYQEKGFNDVQVTILEGTKPKERGAIYLINEGRLQKLWYIHFEGNTIASDARLRTQIESKPPILYLFKGHVDAKKIADDVDKLTSYYRSLGFFRARVGRELEWNEDQNWLTLTFVIDEGPRYKVRNITLVGNEKFSSEALTPEFKLKGGDYFDQPKLNADLGAIKDIYGSVGYVFADVQPDTRFLEEPGQVDLVYSVAEGKRYRVGKILVKIEGDHPHTRQQAVLNRISLRPGDIVDIRKLRDSERRLKASGLFLNDPQQGAAPKLAVIPPDLEGGDTEVAERPERDGRVRGQSPDAPQLPPTAPGTKYFLLDGQYYVLEPMADARPAPSMLRNMMGNSGGRPLEGGTPARAQVRGQSPDPRYQNYGKPPEVIRGQYSGAFDGQSVGPLGPPPTAPRNYQPPPAAYAPPPAAYAPPASAYAPPSNSYAPPAANYGPPGGYTQPAQPAPPGAVQPNVFGDPTNGGQPVQSGPQPTPLFGNPFGNNGPPQVDENGFAPPDVADGYVDIESAVQETQTGRFMFGVGVNSDAGVVGSIVIDEQNFDWRRWPRNGWEDFRNGTAFRGNGQRFRIEAAPGTQVQRYLINYSDPYLNNSNVSFGLSGFYYTRGYTDWTEERLGGNTNLGYQFTPDLSGTIGFGAQNVNISNPRQPTPPALAEVLGNTALYTVSTALQHDTRDNTFLATEGHLIKLGFDYNFGSFQFPRFTADLRRFFMLRERPDNSGRHVLSLIGRFGISGDDTPIYERFFAGGFSTLRGFRFRGASPVDMNVTVGGDFQLLGSAEYMFPITADDMLRGVIFTDAGTVEPTAHIDWDQFRVAPGFGFRVTVPALGPAPIALDFAFPVAFADTDQKQVFSFFVGFGK